MLRLCPVDKGVSFPLMIQDLPKYYHLHLVSDSTGETLATIAKAVTVQYAQMRALEHIHPKVLGSDDLKSVLKEISSAPGIVLYTIIDKVVARELELACSKIGIPCIAVLDPIMSAMEAYLGLHKTRNVAGQHVLDSDYYRRIDALNFALQHDDGANPKDLVRAQIILLGATRTSKTPTTIYLANHGIMAANLAVSQDVPFPDELFQARHAFVAGLVASPDYIMSYVMAKQAKPGTDGDSGPEISSAPDKDRIAADIEYTRRVCAEHGWPVIDISARSIEETAAEIMKQFRAFEDRTDAVVG